MPKTITFNELRRIKDSLPDGSMHRIADELNVTVQTVRNYFGGNNYEFGKNCGLHIEPGPDGGSPRQHDHLRYGHEDSRRRERIALRGRRAPSAPLSIY